MLEKSEILIAERAIKAGILSKEDLEKIIKIKESCDKVKINIPLSHIILRNHGKVKKSSAKIFAICCTGS